jgi:hypothetical protein
MTGATLMQISDHVRWRDEIRRRFGETFELAAQSVRSHARLVCLANSIRAMCCTIARRGVALRFTFRRNLFRKCSAVWTTGGLCRICCTGQHRDTSKR